MRIGIDARFLGFNSSGMARYSESLLEALAHADQKNQYVVFVHARLRRRLRLGSNFHVVPVRGQPLGLRSMYRMARLVHRESLDLLHVTFPLFPLWLDLPILLTVHDVLPFTRESGFHNWKLPLARWIYIYLVYPICLRRATWIQCVSNWTRDAVAQLFPDVYHKCIVVHSGVDEVFRTPIEQATGDLIRSRLELPERYVLYSGSLRRDKNVLGVLRTFATLLQRNPQFKDLGLVMEISGDATNLDLVRKAIHQYELAGNTRMFFDMKDEERRVIFSDASALLILSRAEGFGFPIIEAQLSGVPVVAADSGALPEIAGEAGAVLVDPDKLDDCVSMLERALNSENLRAYLTANGRKNAEKYAWASSVQQLIQIYELLFYPRDVIDHPGQRKLSDRLIEWLPF